MEHDEQRDRENLMRDQNANQHQRKQRVAAAEAKVRQRIGARNCKKQLEQENRRADETPFSM